MDAFIDILSGYGYIGFFIAAFIAGSVFPFSSEAVMVGLIAAGLDPVQLVVYGTIGNTLGSMFNYGVGRLGKPEWISRYLHVKDEQLKKTERFLAGRGAWMGVLTFLPILGSAISVALGLMRANVVITATSVLIGKLARYVILMLGTTAIVGCTSAPHTMEKHTITVSIEPLRYFTEGVAGDKYMVTTMLPTGASPETYEPTGQQMMDMSNNTLYIMVGRLGFESSWVERFKNAAPQMKTINASEDIADNGDPHVWTSPRNAKIMIAGIAKALISVNSKDSAYFAHRRDSMIMRIDSLDRQFTALASQHQGKAFLIYHPTLTYMARDYGLRQIVVENDGKEPSAMEMKNIIEQAKADKVSTILLQKEFARHNVEALAKETGAEIKEINPLAYDWEEEMTSIMNTICNR